MVLTHVKLKTLLCLYYIVKGTKILRRYVSIIWKLQVGRVRAADEYRVTPESHEKVLKLGWLHNSVNLLEVTELLKKTIISFGNECIDVVKQQVMF